MKKFLLIVLMPLCLGCSSHIDEQQAKVYVAHKLSLSGKVSVCRLGGGLSGSAVFLVTDGSGKYVVKFFKNKRAGK